MDSYWGLFAACPTFAAGQQQAEADLAGGAIRFWTYGKRPRYWGAAAQVFRTRYGIELLVDRRRRMASAAEAWFCGYNARMSQAANDCFGRDVYNEVWSEVAASERARRG